MVTGGEVTISWFILLSTSISSSVFEAFLLKSSMQFILGSLQISYMTIKNLVQVIVKKIK